MRFTEFGIFVFGLCATGCVGSVGVLPACDDWSSSSRICGVMNPEDLATLPVAGWVLVSEMTHSLPTDEPHTFVSGRLTGLRLGETGEELGRRVLFPHEWAEVAANAERWGDPSCAGPPSTDDFQPHGIDVGRGPSGRAAVAVVTHGDREVIDLFEIGVAAAQPTLTWRGCVAMRPGRAANDVALLDEGGFVVTDMIPRIGEIGPSAIWTMLKISFGAETGSVLRWTPTQNGFVEISNSRGSAPNGVAATPDGRSIYVAEWGAQKVVRLRIDGAGPRTRTEIQINGSPDNLTWTPAGRLLVAAQEATPREVLGCGAIQGGGCDVNYSVTEIDPETMTGDFIAWGRGAASVALSIGREILVGVFSGDAIERH